ncbi:MAG TPA: hypothetical protein VFV67_02025 [Actinophytocola sp.]|uniref:hypothetical protein n=1 Tax=Actinophytocola sp. TaxID=1872138 RepID=UPI002DB5A1E6|nr:hypothetical protein [Actinophytocola sp.]HEU5469402.1 hypothetical protein [Actinophytocola sp.]
MRWILIGTAILVVALVFGGLDSVFSNWFAGRQASSITLFGLPMFWWGRIGKVLQFFAGCVVVLDLIGPERLRAAAELARIQKKEAGRWRNRIQELEDLLGLEFMVRDQIIRPIYPMIAAAPVLIPLWITRNDPPQFHGQRWLADDAVSKFRAEFLAEFKQSNVHNPTIIDEEYAMNKVRAFVRVSLPTRQRELLDHREDYQLVRNVGVATARTIALIIIVAILVWVGISLGWTGWAPAIAMIGIFTCGILMITTEYGAIRLAVRIRSAVVIGITGVSAALLEQTRPGHRIRWFAFLLFVIGFAFDLLSS